MCNFEKKTTSQDALASIVPLWLKATEVTQLLWPLNVLISVLFQHPRVL